MIFLAIGFAWGVCGFLAYGLIFAHFQRSFPSIAHMERDDDRRVALIGAILGPIGLGGAIFVCRHGLMWRDPK